MITAIATAETETASRPRLAIVISHPIQHFCPMYRAIAEDGRVELRVLFAEGGPAPRFDAGFGLTTEWQADLTSGFDFHAIEDIKAAQAVRAAWTLGELESFAPDVVYVHGYSLPYLRAAMRWAKRRGAPVMMTTDSELLHARPLLTRALKRVALPWILNEVKTFLTVGDENERYYRHYGVPARRFHRAPFAIDSPCYEKALARRDELRAGFRAEHGIAEDAVVLLTVGKLIPRKAQTDLLAALGRALPRLTAPAVLLIAGEGPDRAKLEEAARPLGEAVRFLGFVRVEDLPACYVAADVYVHPSHDDPHPLAISEAIYCGLPVLCSDRIGSIGATDDVQPGRNGGVYVCGDVAELTELLVTWVNDAGRRAAASVISRGLGEPHAADRVAGEFVGAAFAALGAGLR